MGHLRVLRADRSEALSGALYLLYFVLAIPAGIGVFVRGAVGPAIAIVVLGAGPIIALLRRVSAPPAREESAI